jgi:signal transduction histidine kinase
VLPVQVDGRVWGWILLGNADERRRRDADVAVLLTASDGIGLAVRREEALRAALTERAARARAEQARATELAETNARLARSLTRLTCEASLDAFVYQLHRELCDLLGGAATSQFEIHGSRGLGGKVVDAGASPGSAPDVTVAVQAPAGALPADVGSELLRVAQAALANALSHAGARRIVVDLAYPRADALAGSPPLASGLRISVADDGRGFDPETPRPGRYGLAGMYERAARVGAELTLVTAPGEGTEVVVMWCPRRYAAAIAE